MTHKILRAYEIQTDHLFPDRRTYLVHINKNKRTGHQVDVPLPAEHREKMKETEKMDKYLDLTQGTIKIVEHERDGNSNCSWYVWNRSEGFGEKNKGIGNQRSNRNRTDHSTNEII